MQGGTQVTSLVGGNGIEQHGVQTPMNPGSETVDPYVAAVLQQFQSGQAQARVAGAERLPNNDLLSGLGILPQNVTHVNSGETHTPPTNANSNSASPSVGNNTSFSNQQSWKDPQIYLSAEAVGKSTPNYYEITDFVSGHVEEEVVVGGNGSQQVIIKSGPRLPKLEAISLAQWSVANLAILYKLFGEGRLDLTGILDYLSYTTKICQLVQRFNLISVLVYDREYRKL